jgi:predicted dehydrogenase
METNSIDRRKFIATGALTIGGILATQMNSLSNPFEDKTIRLGLIGTGARGTGLATVLKDIKGIKLVACCDVIPEHLSAGMKLAAPDAKAYTDYRKLLEDKTIDAVIIATPLYLHYPMAIHAIEAGKHIFLEKSMTYTIQESLDLVKKVRDSKLVFQVGFQYRNYALYHKVKEILDQNWLGTVTHFECQYNRNSNWRFPNNDPKLERAINWRMYREYCGGPLSELCAHQIDAVNYFLDSHPTKVTAMGGINYWKDGRETFDNIRAIYEYPNGIKSSVTSVLSNAYNGYSIRILGDKATLEIQRDQAFIYRESLNNAKGVVDGVSGATIKATTQGQAEEVIFAPAGQKLPEPTANALQDFVDSINTGKKPLSNVDTARVTSIAIHIGNAAADTETFQTWKPEYSL